MRGFLMQIFGFPVHHDTFQEVLSPSETFPLWLRCDLIQLLELTLGNDMFVLVPEMCYMIGSMLTDLTLRYHEC